MQLGRKLVSCEHSNKKILSTRGIQVVCKEDRSCSYVCNKENFPILDISELNSGGKVHTV